MEKDNSIGDKIKQLRKAKGYTQEELAELIGIDNKHLSRIEKGYHSPKYSIMQKLAQVLEFDLFATDNVKIKNVITKDKILKKIIHIFNSAETEEEKQCYLSAIQLANKCYKLGKNTK